MSADEVEQQHQTIPRDREIVLYCGSPNEVSAAHVAMLLHRLGGIEAWQERRFPVEATPPPAALAPSLVGLWERSE